MAARVARNPGMTSTAGIISGQEVQSDISRIESGKKTVTVAYKGPTGLILRLHRPITHNEPVVGGGSREVTVHVPTTDAPVHIRGNAAPHGRSLRYPVIGGAEGDDDRGKGFALTEGVDAAFFAKWLEQNAEHPAVKEGLIWAYDDQADIQAKARELEATISGLEPLDMETKETIKVGGKQIERIADRRVPTGIMKGEGPTNQSPAGG